MRLEDYWKLDAAIRRIQDLADFCERLQYDPAFDRKFVQGIRHRLAGPLTELEKTKQICEAQLQARQTKKRPCRCEHFIGK